MSGKLALLQTVAPHLRARLMREMMEGVFHWRPSRPDDCRAAAAAAKAWLFKAHQATEQQGFAALYSLTAGYASAYPETTGYLVTTLFHYAKLLDDAPAGVVAKRCADWLVKVQIPDGSIEAGYRGMQLPGTIFNTGMGLSGWVTAYEELGEAEHLSAARRAVEWLMLAQDEDGAWRRHLSQFAEARPFNTYHVLVAWEMARFARVADAPLPMEFSKRALGFALTQQHANGFFDGCQMAGYANPITHTLGYTVQGLLEGGVLTGFAPAVEGALKALRVLCSLQRRRGGWAGIYNEQWQALASWECLTGNAQLTLLMYRAWQLSGESEFLRSYRLGLKWLMRQQMLTPELPEVHGAMFGSFPIYGGYHGYSLPNWGVKYLLDALLCQISAKAGASV